MIQRFILKEDGPPREVVFYSDHLAEMKASQSRVERLEAALRHHVESCSNCEGLGYKSQTHGSRTTYEDCAYCKTSRAALANDAGEGV